MDQPQTESTKATVDPVHVANRYMTIRQGPPESTNKDEISSQESSKVSSLHLLDMTDLASILDLSQILSSLLQTDKLMAKMASIITDITGANLVAIVVKDERNEFSISATGTPGGTTTFTETISMDTSDVNLLLASQVARHVLHSQEFVFTRNITEDDRFPSISPEWLSANIQGASIISMPIIQETKDLLGIIHVEGPANNLTERHLTLLRLLVNQIAISLTNAYVLKNSEKVSADNAAMVGMQHKALLEARDAEVKANDAQAEAERNMRLKEEASKAKSMFLANVSHELRTPLNGVLGMSELLKETNLTDQQTEFTDNIRICADTLLSVINDLLDFTKLEAGRMIAKRAPLDLSKLIKEVVRALSFQNNQKGLETVTKLEIDPNLILSGDAMKLHQLLMNLLSNSYKFTSHGSVTVQAVPVEEGEDFLVVKITVTDTGIGVTEEQRTKLFQPFSQVESNSSRSFQGTGLGLAICKSLVQDVMGGKIWLDSKPGEGTTVGFTVRFNKATEEELAAYAEAHKMHQQQQQQQQMRKDSRTVSPAIPQSSTFTQAIPMESQTPAPAEDGHTVETPYHADISAVPQKDVRVLIAEDNLVNSKIAVAFVQRLGLSCDTFVNGRLAITALEEASKAGKPYHLCLLDIQMPVCDGYTAAKEIRQHADPAIRDVLMIAMTASAIQGDKEKCLEAGMNDYLSKPVRFGTLKKLLDTYLDPPAHPTGSISEGQTNDGKSTSSVTLVDESS